MKTIIGLSAIVLMSLVQTGFGQDDYGKWLKNQQEEYSRFVSKQDKEFIGFLKEQWIKVPVNKAAGPIKQPEPIAPVIYSPSGKSVKVVRSPVAEPMKKSNASRHGPPVKGVPASGSEEPEVSPATPAQPSAANGSGEEQQGTGGLSKSPTIKIDYFGAVVSIPVDNSLDVPFKGQMSNDEVAGYWKKLSEANYKPFLSRARDLKESMELNDWGYCKLLFDAVRKVDHGGRNSSYLLTWFMLVKSGYLARIGYEGNKAYLLIPTKYTLFDVPFFRMGNAGEKYYVLLLDSSEQEPKGAIVTYKTNYPGASCIFNFGFKNLPKVGNSVEKRVIDVSYRGRKYSFTAGYNDDLIRFYRYYPTTNLQVYFSSHMSPVAKSTLLSDLKSAIGGMKETAAVNFLLHFVQYATGYKTDPQQFGHQKFFFPEESLHYRFSDCADRAVFFSYLVRTLVGLKVIGLEYPDHLSTAVKFTSDVPGDYVMDDGSRYVICDPTYIGAPIGQAMPKYLHAPATIVR